MELDKYTLAYLYTLAKAQSDGSARCRITRVMKEELAQHGFENYDEIREYVKSKKK